MNSTVADVGRYTIEERKRRFQDGTQSGDKDKILVWAGTGASLVNDLKPAKVSDGSDACDPCMPQSSSRSSFAYFVYRQTILEDLHAAAVERLNAVKDAVIDI